MKKYIKLLPSLIALSFLMLFFLPSVKGFNDLNFEFQKDVLYTNLDVNNEFNNTFNIRNQSYYDLGNYSATYSFDNDIIDSIPNEWTNISTGIGNAKIISDIVGHKKVLELYHGVAGIDDGGIDQEFFSAQVSGTTEYWFRTNDSSYNTYMLFYDDVIPTQAITFRVVSDEFRWHDGAWQVFDTPATDNTWFHIRIDFECGVGGYKGLDADTAEIFINSISQGVWDFGNVVNSLAKIRFRLDSTIVYYSYFDAIGYSYGRILTIDYVDILDFSDDIVGNEPIGWNSANEGNCTTIIKDALDGRSNILELYDPGGGGTEANIYKDLNINAETYIQIDCAKDLSAGGTLKYGFYENDINIILIGLFDDDLLYYDDGWNTIKLSVFTVNIFIVVNITFDFDTDTIDVYIDDVLEANNLPFNAVGNSEVDRIRFFTDDFETTTEFYGYFDNIYIGYTNKILINYSVGKNVFPIEVFTDTYAVDRYEFALESVNTMRPFGSEQLGTWQAINPGQDYVNIKPHVDDNNRVVEIYVPSGVFGIKKDNFTLTNEFIDITLGFDFTLLAGDQSYFHVVIKSSDTTTISGIQMFHNGSLGIYTDIELPSTIVWNGLRDERFYEFSFRLNYELDICFLDFWINGIFEQSFIYPLIEVGKSGLSYIGITGDEDDGTGEMEIEYVGVYGDLIPESFELGWISLDLNISSWNFKINNLVSVLAEGYFHLGGINGSYLVGESFGQVNDFFQYSGVSKMINAYNSDFTLFNPFLIATIEGKNFTILTINIEGVKLIQDTNEYPLIFTYGGVNIHDNYFFVDSNNNLRFIHNTNQDDILEFIQAEFVIQNRSSTDSAISFLSDIDNNAYGFFRLKFSTTSLIIQMENILNTKRVLLESNKTIDSFVILITDTNKNSIEGITEGLITDIKILDIESSIATIVSLNLIEMIIPLIIILLPTVSISKLYGDFLVIPLFFIFSLILTITNLIPIWLFFVISLSSSLFIFFEKDKKVVF